VAPQCDFEVLPGFSSRLRSTSKYLLKADISKFYPSLYSHSIPWALHTKSIAKSHRTSPSLLGNLLDKWIRCCQDQQTVGIPIGPDTSLVISELVLSAADVDLSSRFGNLNGFRHVDDFEFGLQTYSDAERLLARLQEVLKDYELDLNFDKTRILELPQPLDSRWATELRTYNIRRTKAGCNDLIHYFNRAYELAREFPDAFVLNYAVGRLEGVMIQSSNLDLVQDFLLQCLMVEAGTFLQVLRRLKAIHLRGLKVDRARLQAVMNFQIMQHSPSGHGSEVAWALWAMIYWSLTLSKEAADAVSKMEDSVVALLALDAEQKGLVPTGVDKTVWQSFMTHSDLYDRQWLLAYEANTKGWLAPLSGPDYVSSDPNFGFLKAKGVAFYDAGKLFTMPLPATPRSGIRSTPYSMI
jgi:Reverse transcriptase (RNA-dependent DNA polymerase)